VRKVVLEEPPGNRPLDKSLRNDSSRKIGVQTGGISLVSANCSVAL
jgi:hypothetical protein